MPAHNSLGQIQEWLIARNREINVKIKQSKLERASLF